MEESFASKDFHLLCQLSADVIHVTSGLKARMSQSQERSHSLRVTILFHQPSRRLLCFHKVVRVSRDFNAGVASSVPGRSRFRWRAAQPGHGRIVNTPVMIPHADQHTGMNADPSCRRHAMEPVSMTITLAQNPRNIPNAVHNCHDMTGHRQGRKC